MGESEIILVAAPDVDFRQSLAFALRSDGFRVFAYPKAVDAFISQQAQEAACAVIDDDAVVRWDEAHEQFSAFAKPVILLIGLFVTAPELPGIIPLVKPFLGEPLIEAVRNAVAERNSGAT